MRSLHPLTAVRDALAYGAQLGSYGLFVGVAASAVDAVPFPLLFVAAPLGVLAGMGYGLARYAVFEYDLGETALHITSGVVQRQQREIPLERVQNVDVQQSALQRVFGLAVVRFETAGGGSTEATLRMVGVEEADRLQRELRRRKRAIAADDDGRDRRGPTEPPATERDTRPDAESPDDAVTAEEAADRRPGETAAADRPTGRGRAPGRDGQATDAGRSSETWPESAPPGGATGEASGFGDGREEDRTVLFELSLRDLLVLSGVTFRWSVVPLLLFLLPMVDDLLFAAARRVLVGLLAGTTPDPRLLGLAVLALAALLALSWVVSGAITFVNYYDFRLARVGDELVYERGLLQRYSGSIPLDKVQTLTVAANPLMRRFGYAALTVETAGYGPGGSGGDGGVPSAVPLAPREQVARFVDEFEGVDDLSVERPPKRARRRYLGRYTLALLGLTAVGVAVDTFVRSLGPFWALPLVGLPLVPPAAHLKWVHLGHRTGEDHFLARAGFWRRTTRVVPHYRIQTVITERTVFQRRWGLASVVADTAASGAFRSRSATAHDVDRGTADALHDHLRERLRASLAERRSD